MNRICLLGILILLCTCQAPKVNFTNRYISYEFYVNEVRNVAVRESGLFLLRDSVVYHHKVNKVMVRLIGDSKNRTIWSNGVTIYKYLHREGLFKIYVLKNNDLHFF